MKRTLAEVARVTGGRLVGADRAFLGVSTDTRTLESGALFVALRGPNFDGGEFLAAAAARGAVGALVMRDSAATITQVVVPDTLAALQTMALAWRRNFQIPVVAVAGSNGKTTTKEMVSAILSRGGACLSTRGNLNNHIGVPLTLMRLDGAHRSAVIEMGANRVGDVAELVRWVLPGVAIVTNAGAVLRYGKQALPTPAKNLLALSGPTMVQSSKIAFFGPNALNTIVPYLSRL